VLDRIKPPVGRGERAGTPHDGCVNQPGCTTRTSRRAGTT
jgi:hypothetical protein